MMRASIVLAVAHTAELTKNIASAANTIGRRPQMSDSFDQMGPEAALANKKAPPIQV